MQKSADWLYIKERKKREMKIEKAKSRDRRSRAEQHSGGNSLDHVGISSVTCHEMYRRVRSS